MKNHQMLIIVTFCLVASVSVVMSELNMTLLGGRNYYFSKVRTTVLNARTFCRSHGLELAALETEEENRLVVAQNLKEGGDIVFVGGTDEGSEGTWRWSGSEQALNFTNWREDQPNGDSWSNCMTICDYDVSRGAWCDFPCYADLRYVCEKVT